VSGPGSLRISKKDRIDSWEFRKKSGSVYENSKKRSDQFLGIPEKADSVSGNLKKRSGRELMIPEKRAAQQLMT
jgi:hypothetical protein